MTTGLSSPRAAACRGSRRCGGASASSWPAQLQRRSSASSCASSSYAASAFGEPLLSANGVDDLDDRLDEMLGQDDVFHWNVLASQVAKQTLQEPIETSDFAAAAEPALGAEQVRELERAAPLLDAYFQTQRAVLAALSPEEVDEARRQMNAVGPAVLTNPDVAPEVAASLAGGLQAGLCLLAVARAVLVEQRRIPPWLSHALVERIVAGFRAHLRLLAVAPGADVPESVLPAVERLDLETITERHRRARAHAERTYVAARTRLLRDA